MGKIIKWNDFCGQELRKKKGKSALSIEDFCVESEDFWTKPKIVIVYSRNSTRKNREGKMLKYYSESLQKDDDALLVGGKGSEAEEGIRGFSSSDDDNSSEEFNNPSVIDNEVEKKLQEEAAFEGVRCLLGAEDKVTW